MQARLQKILSSAGVASRRAAERLIEEGRVTVNGRTMTELGTKADVASDDIRVDGRRIKVAARRYILLNKPRGYITSRSDPERRPTVIDLLEQKGVREYIYPVGRLDFDSEGLLILTTDGELAARLTHPRHGVEREYEVRVRGIPGPRELQRLASGVVIDGRRTAPAEISLDRVAGTRDSGEAVVSLVVHEGRNRQVRRMCEAIGHPVMRLRRVRIGPIVDDRLRPGQFRELTAREVAALKGAAAPGAARTAHGRGHVEGRNGESTPTTARASEGTRRTAATYRADPSRTSRGPISRISRKSDRPRRG